MRLRHDAEGVLVETDAYRLEVHPTQPSARLSEPGGSDPMQLFLLAGLDSDAGLDGTLAVGVPQVTEQSDEACTIAFETTSTIWEAKQVRLRCSADEVAFTASVRGSGRLTEVRLLGGWYSGNPRWGGGIFRSRWSAQTVFDPSPDDPRRILQPATEPATAGVVGGTQPGRGHWFFTPAPLLIAGSPAPITDPDDPAGAPWQTLEIRARVEEITFTEVRYAPFLGAFSIELAYEGHTAVSGSFTTPALVVRLGAAGPYEAVREHAARMREAGLAPAVERRPAEWWTRPIFCGWGEQSRQQRLDGHGTPMDRSRRELYDRWLGILAGHGIVPGTVVIDDRWQLTYGANQPDPERWPDLRGWIADRHADDQRVLLWVKAWDPEGLPPEAVIHDRLGHPVAADPTSEAYARILRESMHAMLSPDGLDADGLKVDFTAQTPSGPGLRWDGETWGVALLHRLLGLMYRFAKEAKPDALVVTHSPSPLFADATDMIRLNDLMRLDEPDPFTHAVPQMRHRARVVAAVEPGLPIDTDDWCMPSKAEWRAYLEAKPDLGVPALYYATGIDYSGEAFDDADYAAIRDAWARWEARRMHDD